MYSTSLYNTLMGNTGNGGNNTIGRYSGSTSGGTPADFFARKWRSIENAGGTTGAAIYDFAKQVNENRDTRNLLRQGNRSLDDVYKKYGFQSKQDYYDQIDRAEAAGNQDELNRLLNNAEMNAELQSTATATKNAMDERDRAYDDYRKNNYAAQKVNQDQGKFLGSSINTLSTLTDVLGVTNGPLSNAIQGGLEGIADELEDNGFQNFSWERAGQNAAIGAASGAATGAFNASKLGKNLGQGRFAQQALGSSLGRKAMGNALGRGAYTLGRGALKGAASGAIGGAVGGGLGAGMSGGNVLQGAVQGLGRGAQSGAMLGGALAGINRATGIDRLQQGTDQALNNWKGAGNTFKQRWQNTLWPNGVASQAEANGFARVPGAPDETYDETTATRQKYGDRTPIKMWDSGEGVFVYAGKAYNVVRDGDGYYVTRNSMGVPVALDDQIYETPQAAFDAAKTIIDTRDGYSEPQQKRWQKSMGGFVKVPGAPEQTPEQDNSFQAALRNFIAQGGEITRDADGNVRAVTPDETRARQLLQDYENSNRGPVNETSAGGRGNGVWSEGDVNGLKYQVKTWPYGSGYGVDESPLSKVWLKDNKGRTAEYDRGWMSRPISKAMQEALPMLQDYYSPQAQMSRDPRIQELVRPSVEQALNDPAVWERINSQLDLSGNKRVNSGTMSTNGVNNPNNSPFGMGSEELDHEYDLASLRGWNKQDFIDEIKYYEDRGMPKEAAIEQATKTLGGGYYAGDSPSERAKYQAEQKAATGTTGVAARIRDVDSRMLEARNKLFDIQDDIEAEKGLGGDMSHLLSLEQEARTELRRLKAEKAELIAAADDPYKFYSTNGGDVYNFGESNAPRAVKQAAVDYAHDNYKPGRNAVDPTELANFFEKTHLMPDADLMKEAQTFEFRHNGDIMAQDLYDFVKGADNQAFQAARQSRTPEAVTEYLRDYAGWSQDDIDIALGKLPEEADPNEALNRLTNIYNRFMDLGFSGKGWDKQFQTLEDDVANDRFIQRMESQRKAEREAASANLTTDDAYRIGTDAQEDFDTIADYLGGRTQAKRLITELDDFDAIERLADETGSRDVARDLIQSARTLYGLEGQPSAAENQTAQAQPSQATSRDAIMDFEIIAENVGGRSKAKDLILNLDDYDAIETLAPQVGGRDEARDLIQSARSLYGVGQTPETEVFDALSGRQGGDSDPRRQAIQSYYETEDSDNLGNNGINDRIIKRVSEAIAEVDPNATMQEPFAAADELIKNSQNLSQLKEALLNKYGAFFTENDVDNLLGANAYADDLMRTNQPRTLTDLAKAEKPKWWQKSKGGYVKIPGAPEDTRNPIDSFDFKGSRIDYDDDLVITYDKNGKVVYKGIEDYDPMKYEDWKWDEKTHSYKLDGYTKVNATDAVPFKPTAKAQPSQATEVYDALSGEKSKTAQELTDEITSASGFTDPKDIKNIRAQMDNMLGDVSSQDELNSVRKNYGLDNELAQMHLNTLKSIADEYYGDDATKTNKAMDYLRKLSPEEAQVIMDDIEYGGNSTETQKFREYMDGKTPWYKQNKGGYVKVPGAPEDDVRMADEAHDAGISALKKMSKSELREELMNYDYTDEDLKGLSKDDLIQMLDETLPNGAEAYAGSDNATGRVDLEKYIASLTPESLREFMINEEGYSPDRVPKSKQAMLNRLERDFVMSDALEVSYKPKSKYQQEYMVEGQEGYDPNKVGWQYSKGKYGKVKSNFKGGFVSIPGAPKESAPTEAETEVYRSLANTESTEPSRTSKEYQYRQKRNQALLDQYGTIDKPTAKATRAVETIGKIADAGFEKPQDVEAVINKVTGANGEVNKLNRKVVMNAGPINTMDGVDNGTSIDDFIEQQIRLNGLYGTNDAKAVTSEISAILNQLPTRINGTLDGLDDANDVFGAIQMLEKHSANYKGKSGSNYATSTPYKEQKAAVIDAVTTLLKDRIYDSSDISKVVTPEVISDMKSWYPDNEKWSKWVDENIATAKTGADLRAAQAPFVRMGKILDNTVVNSGTFGSKVPRYIKTIATSNPLGLLVNGAEIIGDTAFGKRIKAGAYDRLANRAAQKATPTGNGTPTERAETPALSGEIIGNNGTSNYPYGTIGRYEGIQEGEAVRDTAVPNTASDESLETYNALTGNTTGGSTGYNSALARTLGSTGTSQGTGLSSSDEEERKTYFFRPTGNELTDRLSRALRRASNAGDWDAFGQLFEMYQSTLSDNSKSNTELTNAQQTQLAKFDSAESAIDELETLFNQAGGAKGPIAGWLQGIGGNIGLDSGASTYNQLSEGLVNQIAQAIGKTDSLNTEGEVKRALRLVPQLTDDATTARNKLEALRRMLSSTRSSYQSAYGLNA